MSISLKPLGNRVVVEPIEEEEITVLPILLDPKQAVSREMAVLGLPITVILDPEGREIARLRGDAVIVHYDPFSPREEVLLYSPDGRYLGRGRRYQREKGSHEPIQPPSRQQPIEPLYLQQLQEEHRRRQQQQRAQGVDYHSARQRNVWSLTGFANRFAQLLGRKGGASGLTAQEMEVLSAFHTRHDTVNETRLREAFERAESKTIPTILFQLQQLLCERKD